MLLYNGYMDFGSAEVAESWTDFSSGSWNGSTGDFTFSGSDLSATTGDRAIRSNDSYSGEFTLEFQLQTAPTHPAMYFGLYDVTADGTFSATDASGINRGLTGSHYIYVQHASVPMELRLVGTGVYTITHVAGYGYRFVRDASNNIKVYQNTSYPGGSWTLIHTYASTYSGTLRVFTGMYSPTLHDVDNIRSKLSAS